MLSYCWLAMAGAAVMALSLAYSSASQLALARNNQGAGVAGVNENGCGKCEESYNHALMAESNDVQYSSCEMTGW